MPSIIRVNPRVLTSLTLLVLRQINPRHNIFSEKRGVNERLCIEGVGVDLEPLCSCPWTRCRSYMEASCNKNYFLDIISFGIGELVLCNHGSVHIFSLIPFPGQVKILVFCRSFHPPTSILIYLEYCPLLSRGYCVIALPLMDFHCNDTPSHHS